MTETQIEKRQAPAASIGAGQRGIQLRSLDDMFRFATAVQQSGLAPKGLEKPQQIFIAIQCGLELGLPPMAALRTVAVINGRPCIWGDGMMALVRQSGRCTRIEETIDGEGDQQTATCKAWRKGDAEPNVRTFSMAQAKKAGLTNKDPWQKYPERMLQMRARGFCLRDTFADVLFGLMSAEEAQELQPVFDPTQANGAAKTESLVEKIRSQEDVPAFTPDATPQAAVDGIVADGEEQDRRNADKTTDIVAELTAIVAEKADCDTDTAEEAVMAWLKDRQIPPLMISAERDSLIPSAKRVKWSSRIPAADGQEVV